MKYAEIMKMPTTINGASKKGECHESLLRSYHILEKAKILLANQTAPHLVLELILMMEGTDSWPNL